MTTRSRFPNVTRGLLAVAATCFAVVTLATPAQAITAKGATSDVMIHIHKPSKSADLWTRSLAGRSVTPLVELGETVSYAQGGSTGQGPATDEDCEDHVNLINALNDLIGAALSHELWDAALQATQQASEEIEQAEDNGCFIVWRERPDEPPVG